MGEGSAAPQMAPILQAAVDRVASIAERLALAVARWRALKAADRMLARGGR